MGMQKNTNASEFFKGLSAQDFRTFGLQQVAYIRPVVVENKKVYAIHAADGTALSVMHTHDTALIAVRHNDLEPVTVH